MTTQGSALITLLIVAGLGTLVPYGLEMAALRRLPPSTAGILFSIEPAIAALVGFIALEQSLDLVQIFGLVLVVSAGANILREADI